MTDNVINLMGHSQNTAQDSPNNYPKFTVRINNPGGYVEVESYFYARAVEQVTDLAVRAKEKPKLHWWQYDRCVWPADCVKEYKDIMLD